MALFDDLLKKKNSPFSGVGPLQSFQNPGGSTTTPTPEHPLMGLIRSFLAPPEQTTQGGLDLTGLLKTYFGEKRNDPVGDYNRLASLPSTAPNSLSPFNTGFFKSAADRAQIERDRLGTEGYTGKRLRMGLPAY